MPFYQHLFFALTMILLPDMGHARSSAGSKTKLQSVPFEMGEEVEIKSLGLAITPPKGWKVDQNTGNLTMIMYGPEKKRVGKGGTKIKYKPNLTLATIHRPSPVDKKRSAQLKSLLKKSYAKNSGAKDYRFTDANFFNYKGNNDGLVMYASFTLDELEMMHMHVMVSGSKKQFVMTYTDLASELSNRQGGFEDAFKVMGSIKVQGVAPKRKAERGPFLLIALAVCGLGIICMIFMGRKKSSSYQDVDLEFDDDFEDPYTPDIAHSAASALSLHSKAI
jgi:hypothetical protein